MERGILFQSSLLGIREDVQGEIRSHTIKETVSSFYGNGDSRYEDVRVTLWILRVRGRLKLYEVGIDLNLED